MTVCAASLFRSGISSVASFSVTSLSSASRSDSIFADRNLIHAQIVKRFEMHLNMDAPGVQCAGLAAGLPCLPFVSDRLEGRNALRRDVGAFIAIATGLYKGCIRIFLRIEAFPMPVRRRKSNLPSSVWEFSRVSHDESPFHLSVIRDSLNKPRGRFADRHLSPFPARYRVARHAHFIRQLFLSPAELLSEFPQLFRFHLDTSRIRDTSRIAHLLVTYNPSLRQRVFNLSRIEAHVPAHHPFRDSAGASLRRNPAPFDLEERGHLFGVQ